MSFDNCKKCQEFVYLPTHRCNPTWLVWCPDNGETQDDASVHHGTDAESAAEAWAEEYDVNNSHPICGGGTTVVYVLAENSEDSDEDDHLPQRVRIEGEVVPSYSAHAEKVKDPVTPDEAWVVRELLHLAWTVRWDRERRERELKNA